MRAASEFQTIFAIPTPFRATHSLGLDLMALKDHLQFLHAAGVNSILANGSTGEFPSLTLSERKAILECCRTNFQGTVMNNIGSCCISDSLELLEHSHEHADAVVILPPFYFAPVSAQGLFEFFWAILEPAEVGCYLYNFSKYTQITISPQLLRDLAGRSHVIKGIKDSDTSLDSTIGLKASVPQLQVLSGKDDCLIEVYDANLDGVVAGGFNPFPELLCNTASATLMGERSKARKLQGLISQWKRFCKEASLTSIAAAKLGISARLSGYPDRVRPPPSQRPIRG